MKVKSDHRSKFSNLSKESPRLTGSRLETRGGNVDIKSMQTAAGQYSDIVEGDRILLTKSRDNKLSPTFNQYHLSGGKEGQCCPYRRSGRKHRTALREPHEKVFFSQALALKPLKPTGKTKKRKYPLEGS